MPDLPIKLVEDFLPSHADLLVTLDADVAWEERVKKRPTASYGVPYNYSVDSSAKCNGSSKADFDLPAKLR